ncbi:MAG: hypothetical protein ACKO15_16075, partial [Burkholderiales bacterium]
MVVPIDHPSQFVRLGLARNGTAAEVARVFADWQSDQSHIPLLSVTIHLRYEFGKLPALLPNRVYICAHGKSYQKGQVEHINKLIRQ